MSTYTVSDQPLTAARGRPGSWVMKWQTPAGAPINTANFTASAVISWSGQRTDLTVLVIDPKEGSFRVVRTADQMARLPLGRLSTLNVQIAEPSGEVHDYEIPVIGEVP